MCCDDRLNTQPFADVDFFSFALTELQLSKKKRSFPEKGVLLATKAETFRIANGSGNLASAHNLPNHQINAPCPLLFGVRCFIDQRARRIARLEPEILAHGWGGQQYRNA